MIFVDEALYHKKKNQHVWEIGQSQAWTRAGTFSFTVPDSGYYDVVVVAGGSGGGGAAGGKKEEDTRLRGATGGGGATSGELFTNQLLTKGGSVTVTVGSGGNPGSSNINNSIPNTDKNYINGNTGKKGGNSSFGSLTVSGASGGNYGSYNGYYQTVTAGAARSGNGSLAKSGTAGTTMNVKPGNTTKAGGTGGSGYTYDGGTYGAGGNGAGVRATSSSGVEAINGTAGGSGLVVVTLVAYA